MLISEKTRVGYVLKVYPRYSETFIVNEMLAHEAAGLEVEIFALRPPVDSHFQDIIARVRAPVTYLPSESPKAHDFWEALQRVQRMSLDSQGILEVGLGEDARDVYQGMVLAELARQRGITSLHSHFAGVSTSVARIAARLAGIPYTFTAHAKDIFHESVRPDDLSHKLSSCAAAVTVSDYNVAFLRERYGAAASTVRRLYNGLDLNRFRYEPPHQRRPLLISVGRLVEKKGFPDLLDACAILAQRGRDFQCRIIGVGPLEPLLREQIRRLGIEDRVELMGPRPQDEVIRIIQNGAAFVAPCVVGTDSDRDGLPTVLLEAMALGTPCVSTDVTGIPEILHDGKTGLMVPQHAPLALAAALERLLDDEHLRLSLARCARQHMEEHFDVHRNAAQLRAIFRQAVCGRELMLGQVA